MIRTARYLSWIVWQYLFSLAGMGALLIGFQVLITPPSEAEFAAGRIVGMAFSTALLFPTLLELSMLPAYLPLSLSRGVTRRGFFWGAQVAKLHLALGIAAIFELMQIATQLIFGSPALFYGRSLAGVCMGILVCAALGETLGFVGMRFGRWGITAMCVLIGLLAGVVGGVIGFMSVSDGNEAGVLLDSVIGLLSNTSLLGAVVLALMLVLAGVDTALCRRFTVRQAGKEGVLCGNPSNGKFPSTATAFGSPG